MLFLTSFGRTGLDVSSSPVVPSLSRVIVAFCAARRAFPVGRLRIGFRSVGWMTEPDVDGREWCVVLLSGWSLPSWLYWVFLFRAVHDFRSDVDFVGEPVSRWAAFWSVVRDWRQILSYYF